MTAIFLGSYIEQMNQLLAAPNSAPEAYWLAYVGLSNGSGVPNVVLQGKIKESCAQLHLCINQNHSFGPFPKGNIAPCGLSSEDPLLETTQKKDRCPKSAACPRLLSVWLNIHIRDVKFVEYE